MLFAKLFGNRTDLLRFKLARYATPEPIDPGDMFVLIEIHHARAAPHLHEHMRFLYGMTRKHATVLATPIVNLFHEAVDKETMHRVPVFIPERIRAVTIYEKLAEFFP